MEETSPQVRTKISTAGDIFNQNVASSPDKVEENRTLRKCFGGAPCQVTCEAQIGPNGLLASSFQRFCSSNTAKVVAEH